MEILYKQSEHLFGKYVMSIVVCKGGIVSALFVMRTPGNHTVLPASIGDELRTHVLTAITDGFVCCQLM